MFPLVIWESRFSFQPKFATGSPQEWIIALRRISVWVVCFEYLHFWSLFIMYLAAKRDRAQQILLIVIVANLYLVLLRNSVSVSKLLPFIFCRTLKTIGTPAAYLPGPRPHHFRPSVGGWRIRGRFCPGSPDVSQKSQRNWTFTHFIYEWHKWKWKDNHINNKLCQPSRVYLLSLLPAATFESNWCVFPNDGQKPQHWRTGSAVNLVGKCWYLLCGSLPN